jgi:hypothetical protein
MALPLGGVMVIDPLELFGDYHLTPTRGRIKTVNWNLKGAGNSAGFYIYYSFALFADLPLG